MLTERQGGSVTATYTYGNALLRKDGETPLFDGLGSERTVTNSSGSGTGSLTLSAFGQTVASSGTSASVYKFGATSGYRDDGDSGLVKVGCRYYDPEVGRFITRDTVLSQKAYVYCEGNPVNGVDPSGHLPKWKKVWATILGVANMLLGQGNTIEENPPVEPPIVSQAPGGKGNDGDDDNSPTNIVGTVAGGVAIGVTVVIVGLLLAPETGGASLLLLAAA